MSTDRIAIVTSGGIVGGHFDQGLPPLVELVTRLGRRFDITVYQNKRHTPKESQCSEFSVHGYAPGFGGIHLVSKLVRDHARAHYRLVHGLWAGGGLLAVRAARLLKLPVVVSLLGGEVARVPEIAYGGLLSDKRIKVLRHVCTGAAAVTTVSRFQAQKLADVCGVHTHVIPLGVDAQKFAFREGLPRPPYRFLHVANLTAVKDQTTLIKAFAEIRKQVEGHLTIVGPDYFGGKLQTLAAELGLQDDVTFTGAIRHPDLPQYYRDSDIYLHSSLYESEAVAALEAMACGAVVCGTAVGILADLQEDCCLTVSPGDAHGLAQSVLQLLSNPERIEDLQRRARAWAAAHDADWTAREYEKIFESLIAC